MTDQPQLTRAELAQFTGTENWYRHPLVRDILYTDGAKFLAERAGAYWLLDEIAIALYTVPAVAAEAFQLWKLAVNADRSAMLTCEDGDGNAVFRQIIPFTDFPLDAIELYCTDNTILLPSEY